MVDIIDKYSSIKDEVEKTMRERATIVNRRGKTVSPRKYHVVTSLLDPKRDKWRDKMLSKSLFKVSDIFFNPYRCNGAYYGAVQSLFLLGSNAWHPYNEVRCKMQEDMSGRKSLSSKDNSWDKFANKIGREGAAITKDLMGRIVQNFRTLQRLGGIHPYGMKLKQVNSCIDIRRTNMGIWEFRLNTSFPSSASVLPSFDISLYDNGLRRGKRVKKVVVPVGTGLIGTE